jgi:hypothetical protein
MNSKTTWLGGLADAFINGVLAEIKCPNCFQDEVSLVYMLQCQGEMYGLVIVPF